MTSGDDLIRQQRLALIRAAERRYGLQPSTKMATLDLTGAVYAGGGEIDLEPTWFDMPGLSDRTGSRRVADVKRYGTGNSAAFALIESFARAYREPPLYVYAGPYMDIEASERLADHPLCRADGLLRRPNGVAKFTMGNLRSAIAKAKLIAGDYYLVKARSGGGDVRTNTTGAVRLLWPVWPTQMSPAVYDKTDGPQSNGWVDYYAYNIGKGKPIEIPVENVIHFRNGINPRNPRTGIGVVEEFALEVASDAEAALLVQAVMSNLGVPGLVFAPKDDPGGRGISDDDRAQIKASLIAKTTGGRRGEPIVLTRPTTFEQFDVSLEALDLSHVWTHVESRISAVIGWPAILAGLQAGLENATYSNAQSLKRFATENAAIPTWEDDAEVWTTELGPEFGLSSDEYIAYDYPSVRALQEDRNDRWKRIGEAFGRNEITIGQHHAMLGIELPPGIDEHLRAADLAANSQLSRLLGPGIQKGIVVEGAARPLLGKAVERFQAAEGDVPLTEAELDEGELTPERVSAAIRRMADRLSEVDPAMAGVLDAEEPEEEGEKRLPFLAATKADPRKRTWIWDRDKQRYRWPNTGRLVPEGRVFRARERLVEDSRKRMRSFAQQYTNGEISLSQMQKRMRREYTDQHIAMRALGKGGAGQLTRADREDIWRKVKAENQYLAGFARDIADGKLTPDQIAARAELYAGANMRQEYAAGRLESHIANGYTHKQRVGPNDDRTCSTCASEIAMGRVPIDAVGFVIGGTECGSNDRCEILFYREGSAIGRVLD